MRPLGVVRSVARSWLDAAPAVAPLRFRGVPMLVAALCFAAGDVFARHWHETVFLFSACLLLFALSLVGLRRAPRIAAFPVLAFWTAVGCWCAQVQPSPQPQHALLPYADGLSRTVRGRVVRVRRLRALPENSAAPQQPQGPWQMEPGAWEMDSAPTMESVDLQVDAVEEVTPDTSTMRPVSGGVRVAINGGQPELVCGDVLELPLRLRVPETYHDPGAWSYADQLASEGIGVQANVKAVRVTRVSGGRASWRCRVYAAQMWAVKRLDNFIGSPANGKLPSVMRLSVEDAAMLGAMLFGDRGMLAHTLRVGFERTGTFHLFVVSGLHVAIVAGALFWVLRKFRLPEGLAVLATTTAATGYALLTGFGVPVQRALMMSVAYLLARWLGRERNHLNALGAAALAVLAWDPRALFESSFQMTALVILALAGLAAPLADRLFSRWREATHKLRLVRLDAGLDPRTAQFRVRLRMWGTLSATLLGRWARDLPLWVLSTVYGLLNAMLFSLVAETCMMLPMAVYFHRATLLALPLNVLCIPLVGALLCAGIATFCVSLLSAKLGIVPGACTALLLHLVHGAVTHLGRVELADLRVPMPRAVPVVLACAAIAFCCWAFRARQRAWAFAGAGTLALVPVLLLWPAPPDLHAGALEVTALDVGQGDSLLVASPLGGTLLVDAGGPVGRAPSPDRWDVGEEVVAPYLWSRGIRKLDAVLLTHAHSDHMGGMPAVLRDFHPRELWLSVQPGRSPALTDLLDEAKTLGVRVRWMRAGNTFDWSGLHAAVLSPAPLYENAGQAVNDDSLVVRLSFGKGSALLEGDAEARSEAAMLASGMLTPTTLLKVGHHGSRSSTSPEFLAAVAPHEAVISVGAHNTFGHPRFEVLQRLEASGVKAFRTDHGGAETFLLDSDGGISASPATSN